MLEYPIGVDLEEVEIPSSLAVCRETWALMQQVMHGPQWKPPTLSQWLHKAEDDEDHDESKGKFCPNYSLVDFTKAKWVNPKLLWLDWFEPVVAEDNPGEVILYNSGVDSVMQGVNIAQMFGSMKRF